MVKSCAIKNCKLKWAPNMKISFRNFPVKNPDLLAKWLKAIPPELINTSPTQYTYVCSKHFSSECFVPQVWSTRNYLRKNIIPTVFNDSMMESTRESVEATAAVATISTMAKESSIFSDGNSICDKENDQSDRTTTNNDNELTLNPSSISGRKRRVNTTWTQTSSKCLGPSNREVELSKKVKVLQKRLRRQEEKMESMATLIEAMKSRLIHDQIRKFDIT